MTTTPETPAVRTRLTARTPEDLLAAVPVVLGFEPSRSAVMLTFGGSETFHARIDLPPPEDPGPVDLGLDPGGLDSAVELLREPAVRHRVESVVFVLYTDDEVLARRFQARLVRAFRCSGIRVVETLRTDGTRWYSPGRPGVPPRGVPYDASTHRFRAQSVLDGRVIHGSRDELAALVGPTPGVEGVQRTLQQAVPVPADEVGALVVAGLESGRFTDAELASLLVSMADLAARDAVWADFNRANVDAHVDLWTDAVQRSPSPYVADPAAVLALAAWLSGHGALAWCAVDRSHEAAPDNSLAGLVSELLTDAVPPSAWERWAPGSAASECG